jgi:hypothetical protein
MRQTSRAVALLLALDSAQATTIVPGANSKLIVNGVMYANVMIPVGGADNNLMGAIKSRTAPYNSCSYGVTYSQWPSSDSDPLCPITMVSGWTSGTIATLKIANAPFPSTSIVPATLWGTGAVTDGMSDCVPCLQ